MWEAVLEFLTEYTEEAGTIGGIIAVVLFSWGIVKWPFSKTKPTQLAPETIEAIAPKQSKSIPELTVTDFIKIRREMQADLEEELTTAHADEKAQLSARIAELESQLADPDAALAEAQ